MGNTQQQSPEAAATRFNNALKTGDNDAARRELDSVSPQDQLQFARSAFSQAEKSHTTGAVAALLFGNEAELQRADVNNRNPGARTAARFDGGDWATIRASEDLKRGFTPLQQQTLGWMAANSEKIGGLGNTGLTAENLRTYAAGQATRDQESRVAERVAQDPKAVMQRFDKDGDGKVTTAEIQTELRAAHDLREHDQKMTDAMTRAGAAPAVVSAMQDTVRESARREEDAAVILRNQDKIASAANETRVNSNLYTNELTAWAKQVTDRNTEVKPQVQLVAPATRETQANFMPDLMNRFVQDHFHSLALSGAGDGNRITKADLANYSELRKDSLSPQDKQVLGQLQARFDDIKDADGVGLSTNSMGRYRSEQDAQRKVGDEAKVADAALSHKNFDAVAGGQKDAKVVTERQIDDTIARKKDLLDAVGASMEPAKRAEIQQQLALAEYMKKHYQELSTTEGGGMYGQTRTDKGIEFDKLKADLDKKIKPTTDYVDPKGASSSPEQEVVRQRTERETRAREELVAAKAKEQTDFDTAFGKLSKANQDQITAAVEKHGSNLTPDDKRGLKNALTALDSGNLAALTHMVPYGDRDLSPAAQTALTESLKERGLRVNLESGAVRDGSGQKFGNMTIVPEGSNAGIRLSFQRPAGADAKGEYKAEAVNVKPGTMDVDEASKSQEPAKIGDNLKAIQEAPAKKVEAARIQEEQARLQQQQEQARLRTEAQEKERKDYIDKWITDEKRGFGFTGENYDAALRKAKEIGKPVVMVMTNGYNPDAVKGVAEAVGRKDAVYVYVDTTKLPANSPLLEYGKKTIPEGKTSAAVTFDVTADPDKPGQLKVSPTTPVDVSDLRPAVHPSPQAEVVRPAAVEPQRPEVVQQPQPVQQPAFRPWINQQGYQMVDQFQRPYHLDQYNRPVDADGRLYVQPQFCRQ